VSWALQQGKKIFFLPDRHLGENTAGQSGMPWDSLFAWPGGDEGARLQVADLDPAERRRLDSATMILWGSHCGVHTVFEPEHVRYWRGEGYRVLVHPECPSSVLDLSDGAGSTKYLWNEIMTAERGAKLAIATEGHFVRNAREQAELRGVEVVNVANVPGSGFSSMGCGCATMSRNDPPHLVAILDLLRRGEAPELNQVLPGDVVNETTGSRDRLSESERARVVANARRALEKMIEVTRSGG
jgi:quinolinate synthase